MLETKFTGASTVLSTLSLGSPTLLGAFSVCISEWSPKDDVGKTWADGNCSSRFTLITLFAQKTYCPRPFYEDDNIETLYSPAIPQN